MPICWSITAPRHHFITSSNIQQSKDSVAQQIQPHWLQSYITTESAPYADAISGTAPLRVAGEAVGSYTITLHLLPSLGTGEK
jgi:hypothetical protein